ncbi:complex I subunit 5 family protein [Roseomonas sp. NAR14]|uniref:Complex I subunit 5 family protein n=1 Tax=Roseomonas acroporae TaxID=2937791 RepID=A0A9X1YAP1_9PROT|nr:complex I subunit 5 family protein [Roseomonas acroporae]MCK8786247.1 complex I subunit 5 family protein [Roseomonas acroporae]
MSGALLVPMLLVPLGMALACLAAPRARPLGWLVLAPLPALAAALLAADAPPLLFGPAAARIQLALDRPGALLLGGAALLWSAAGAYAAAYLRGKPHHRAFAAWWLLTLFGNLGVFVAGDLISFYVAFSFASLAAYGLVMHDRTPQAWRAGNIYLALAVLGEVALLAGFVLLAAITPGKSLAIADLIAALPDYPRRGLVIGLLVAGFGLKAGLVPLHVWLPVAHPAAPMPASAVLSGAIVKAGIIGLLRFLPLDTAAAGWGDSWGTALLALGLLTAFYGVALGVTQRNPKTVLAYSTVSQMGVLTAVIGAGMAAEVPGTAPETAYVAAYYGLHHLLAKGALFLSVGIAMAMAGRRGWPGLLSVGLPVALVALGMAGLPMTGGALAKLAAKPVLGDGVAKLLASLSAAGTTLLMLHFLALLAGLARGGATGRGVPAQGSPAPGMPGTGMPGTGIPAGMVLPWLLMLLAALLLPWPLFPGDPTLALTPAALWEAAWPPLLGLLLYFGLRRVRDRLPAVPEGDVVVFGVRAWDRAACLAGPLARVEAVLRDWTAAGIALLLVALALIGTMLIGG